MSHCSNTIRTARSLGFTIEDCRKLLKLYDDTEHSSAEEKAVALRQIELIDKKIKDLQAMHTTLSFWQKNVLVIRGRTAPFSLA